MVSNLTSDGVTKEKILLWKAMGECSPGKKEFIMERAMVRVFTRENNYGREFTKKKKKEE